MIYSKNHLSFIEMNKKNQNITKILLDDKYDNIIIRKIVNSIIINQYIIMKITDLNSLIVNVIVDSFYKIYFFMLNFKINNIKNLIKH